MNKRCNDVWATDEYDRFELHELNRDQHKDAKLKESMRKNGFPDSCAIHVRKNGGNKFKIIRGHHRFATAKELGLPVKYIIDRDDLDIYDLEGSTLSVWDSEDFSTSYANGGNHDYQQMLKFKEIHGLTLGAATALTGGESAGSGNKLRIVKTGSFKIGDQDHAKAVVSVTDLCRELGVEFATSSGFVTALSSAIRVPEFDVETFKSRVRLYPKMMSKRVGKSEYLIEIETLYNYGARGKRMPLAMRAHEVSLERQRTFGGTRKS